MVETPTIDKYLRLKAREVGKKRVAFERTHRDWLKAYKNGDATRAASLAKQRDADARRLAKEQRDADRLLYGIAGLWKVEHLRE